MLLSAKIILFIYFDGEPMFNLYLIIFIKGSPRGDGLSRGFPDANHAIEINSEANYTCYSICYIMSNKHRAGLFKNKTIIINLNVQGYTTTVKFKTFHVQAILLLKFRKWILGCQPWWKAVPQLSDFMQKERGRDAAMRIENQFVWSACARRDIDVKAG